MCGMIGTRRCPPLYLEDKRLRGPYDGRSGRSGEEEEKRRRGEEGAIPLWETRLDMLTNGLVSVALAYSVK